MYIDSEESAPNGNRSFYNWSIIKLERGEIRITWKRSNVTVKSLSEMRTIPTFTVIARMAKKYIHSSTSLSASSAN